MATHRQRIIALHETGRSVSEIACELGLAANTVRYHLRQLSETRPCEDQRSAPTSARIDGATRHQVAALISAGLSRAEIARRLGITKSAVSYHARHLGERIDEKCARRYDWTAIQEFHDAGHSMRQCVEHFGFSPASWSQAVARGAIVARPAALSIAELCVDGRPRGREYIKIRLLREGLKANHCENCGIDEWLDGPITLALHHVNGRRTDNRLENLQLLCPNCHSQTENFAGRKRPGAARSIAEPPPEPRADAD